MTKDVPNRSAQMQLPAQVQIGGLDKQALLEALQAHGIRLNPLGLALFRHPGFTTQATSALVDIACVSVADLGFSDGGLYQDIVQAARQCQLLECPLELGPQLRMAFLDQAEGAIGQTQTQNQAPPGSITVASPPLDSDDMVPKGFYLRCIEGTLWIRGYTSWQGHLWSAEDLFVFARG